MQWICMQWKFYSDMDVLWIGIVWYVGMRAMHILAGIKRNSEKKLTDNTENFDRKMLNVESSTLLYGIQN